MRGISRVHARAAGIILGVLLALLGAIMLPRFFHFGKAPAGVTAPVSTAGTAAATAAAPPEADGLPLVPPDTLLAKVNDQPIYEKDITAAIPTEEFAVDAARLRRMKLDRRIQWLAVRQYLDARKVDVPNEVVEQDVAELRKNPPSLGCPCCRYASLDQFMQDNCFTLEELREEIRNGEGMKKYALALWDKAYPKGDKKAELLQKEREGIEQGYVKVCQIFFNMFQQPDFSEAPDLVRAEAQKKANAAFARLKKGETFQAVAREVSEDSFSRANGGDLGCVPKETFGKEFAAAVSALKPGEYCAPVETPWGIHIVLRTTMTDDDILGVLKSEYTDRAINESLKAARDGATVKEFVGQGGSN